MKTTPPEFKPRTPITAFEYDKKVAQYGTPPAGYRFRKVGEKYNEKTDFIAWFVKEWKADAGISKIADNNHPCITPSKRDSRGRFVGAKPLPEVGPNILKWLGGPNISADFLDREIASMKRVIADPVKNYSDVMGLNWSDSSQGSRYWSARYHGKEPVSPADLLYIKATIAAYENRIAELRGKVKPPALEPTVADLKAKISSLEAENAALKAKIAGAKVVFPS